MRMHRKTITLTKQQDQWVKKQIRDGNFGNDSEYVRDLIRCDQQSQERIINLRQALKVGEASGSAKSLDMGEVKKAARARSKSRG